MNKEKTEGILMEIRPCRHMERWVEALSDGSLTGLARWYARLHVAGCRRCRSALDALERLNAQLRRLRESAAPTTLAAHRRDALEAALDEIDRARS